MAWSTQAIARPGQYLLLRTVSGVSFDLLGGISNLDLMERLTNYANGWTPISARIDRGLFSADVRILGQANATVDTMAVATEAAGALDSFWSLAGTSVSVWVSDDAMAPEPATAGDSTASSIRWISVAAIAIAAAIVVVQVRKGIS